MATLPAPHTWVAGTDYTTAANLNSLTDGITFLANVPQVWVYNNADISIATSGTSQALTFNTEVYDTDNMHSTVSNTGRLTASTAGYYRIQGHCSWASNATGYREMFVRQNGTSTLWLDRIATGSGFSIHQEINCPPFFLAVNDYVELLVTQTSTAALNAAQSGIYGIAFAATWVHA